MKRVVAFIGLLVIINYAHSQNNLEYYVQQAEINSPILKENLNLQEIGEIQNNIIWAQNNALQINSTSEIQVAPYFNNNGKFIDLSTNPSSSAFGYDVGITNGGLYSSQINFTKNILNGAITQNLLLQNKANIATTKLNYEEQNHQLKKDIIDTYILIYQLQEQKKLTTYSLKDISTKIEVIRIMVEHGILMQSDLLLAKSELTNKELEVTQIKNTLENSLLQLNNLCGIKAPLNESLEKPVIHSNSISDTLFLTKRFVNDSLQIAADKLVFENQYKPQFSVYGNTGLNAIELNNLEHKVGLSAGVKLTIPIYDGKQKKLNAKQSKLKLDNLKYYKENKEVLLDNNLQNTKLQITNLKGSLSVIEDQKTQQKQLLKIYEEKLLKGLISMVEYLNIYQNYNVIKNTELQVQTNIRLLENQYNFLNW